MANRFNSYDSDYKFTCCDHMMYNEWDETVFCQKYGEKFGTVQSHRDEADHCMLYEKNHYCPLEKKYAEKEKRKREAAEEKRKAEAAERAAAEKKAREEREALEKLRTAAEQGDAGAQVNLGHRYFTGRGVTQDYARAAEWFKKTAAQGNTEAKDGLAKAEAAIEEEKARKAREAREAAERAAKEKAIKKRATFGLVLQLGVTAVLFYICFSGIAEAKGDFLESLPTLLQLALPVGFPALAIGIISLLFRKRSGSIASMCLIILIDIVMSIYFTVSGGEDVGTGILGFIVFFIFAIPGFIMAVMEVKLAAEASEMNWPIIYASGIISILLFIFLPKIGNIDGASQPDVPVNLGKWKFSDQTWSADMYIGTYEDNTFTGYFYWRGKKQYKNVHGTEYFEGTYNEQTQQVFMKGTRLGNNRGLGLGEYQAMVSDEGKKLVGTWSDGGRWEAKWVKRKRQ